MEQDLSTVVRVVHVEDTLIKRKDQIMSIVEEQSVNPRIEPAIVDSVVCEEDLLRVPEMRCYYCSKSTRAYRVSGPKLALCLVCNSKRQILGG